MQRVVSPASGADDPASRPGPAASSTIAKAARAFGDDYPAIRGQWRVRAAGLLLVAAPAVATPERLALASDAS